MKLNFTKIIIFTALMIGSTFAMAGGMEGGGGKSIICRNAKGKITKAELLDLYEGRILYQLTYSESSIPWQDQVIEIFKRAGVFMQTAYPEESTINYSIFNWYQNSIKHLTILPDDVVLQETNDAFEVVAPKGCKIEQVAIYKNDIQILINGEIWNTFSQTQKAALLIHESTYRFLRRYGETSSTRARNFTAHLIAGKKVEEGLMAKNFKIICNDSKNSDSTTFFVGPTYINENEEPKVLIQFLNLDGRQLLSRNSATIDLRYIDKDIWQILLDPFPFYPIEMVTTSLFEPGDNLRILPIYNSMTNKMDLALDGISASNGNHFFSNIKCYPF